MLRQADVKWSRLKRVAEEGPVAPHLSVAAAARSVTEVVSDDNRQKVQADVICISRNDADRARLGPGHFAADHALLGHQQRAVEEIILILVCLFDTCVEIVPDICIEK